MSAGKISPLYQVTFPQLPPESVVGRDCRDRVGTVEGGGVVDSQQWVLGGGDSQ